MRPYGSFGIKIRDLLGLDELCLLFKKKKGGKKGEKKGKKGKHQKIHSKP